MPDVWTFNPPKLKRLLEDSGIECGVPARIIKPRDTEWTCHVDTREYIADIYIQDATPWNNSSVFWYGSIVLLAGFTLGLLIGKRLRRKIST